MQSLVPDPKANYRGVADALVTIFRHEGIGNTVRGIGAVVGGAGPAHALYFACYEHLKKKFSGGEQGNHLAHGIKLILFSVADLVLSNYNVFKQ
jgi:solute carrier family 25 iron transporter 28/37